MWKCVKLLAMITIRYILNVSFLGKNYYQCKRISINLFLMDN